jgi:hypothetical protein
MNNIYKDIIIVITVFIVAISLAVAYDNNSQKKISQDQQTIDIQQLASTSAMTTDGASSTENQDTKIKSDNDSAFIGDVNSYNADINTESLNAEDGYIDYEIRESERQADIMAQEAEQEAYDKLDQVEQEIMDSIESEYVDEITDKAIENMIDDY